MEAEGNGWACGLLQRGVAEVCGANEYHLSWRLEKRFCPRGSYGRGAAAERCGKDVGDGCAAQGVVFAGVLMVAGAGASVRATELLPGQTLLAADFSAGTATPAVYGAGYFASSALMEYSLPPEGRLRYMAMWGGSLRGGAELPAGLRSWCMSLTFPRCIGRCQWTVAVLRE